MYEKGIAQGINSIKLSFEYTVKSFKIKKITKLVNNELFT